MLFSHQESDLPNQLLVKYFDIFVLIAKLKELLIEGDYRSAALVDKLSEQIWHEIKDWLDEQARNANKGPTHCLVVGCCNLGTPAIPPTSNGHQINENVDRFTPYFCEIHMNISKYLNPVNKHLFGRLFSLLLPEVRRSNPTYDHYRASLGSFLTTWHPLFFNSFPSYLFNPDRQNPTDAVLFNFPDLLLRIISQSGIRYTATYEDDNGELKFSSALVDGNNEILRTIDPKHEKLMEGHSYHFFREFFREKDHESSVLFDVLDHYNQFPFRTSPLSYSCHLTGPLSDIVNMWESFI